MGRMRARTKWQVGHTCPANDNRWPENAFGAWKRASDRSRPKAPICDVCLFERYPRVFRSCSTCGGLMYFHSKQSLNAHPQCKACTSRQIPVCPRCKEPIERRQEIAGMHPGCFTLATGTALAACIEVRA